MGVTEYLHNCVTSSEKSVYEIANGSGIKSTSLYRFIKYKNPIQSETIDKLMKYFDLEIVKRNPQQQKDAC